MDNSPPGQGSREQRDEAQRQRDAERETQQQDEPPVDQKRRHR